MIKRETGRALVLGAGASGIAAARLLLKQGWCVEVVDQHPDAGLRLARAGLSSPEVTLANTLPGKERRPDAALISPGFAVEHPWLELLRSRGVPVIPEFEYGVSCLPGSRVVAVTGSNGKSSLVKWIAETLCQHGYGAVAAGNYGLPPCALAVRGDIPGILVLELSSFQLEQSLRFCPEVGVLLNLTPNHLDRHPDLKAYTEAKARLFAFMGEDQKAIIHAPAWAALRGGVPKGLRPLLFDQGSEWDYGCRGTNLLRGGEGAVDLGSSWWGRPPFSTNAAAGLAVFDHFNVPEEVVHAAAYSFEPLPHRLQDIACHRGVRFIDDSKSSTLAAMVAALRAGPEKKHLIAGGILKESDLNFVKEILAETCALVYCIGQSADRLVDAWQDAVSCVNCRTMEVAVDKAMKAAREGEVVLLSPGCSSFDQFTSYAERGDVFRRTVLDRIQDNGQMKQKREL